MKTKLFLSFALQILLVVMLPAAEGTPPPTPLLTRPEGELIRVLNSNPDAKAIADACRELAVVGSKAAVPTLTRLLADERFNHAARYALETIPDRSVNVALREQLPKLQGRALFGVIGSLGVRRDPKAVKPLGRLLGAANPEVAQASARALGSIATTDAVKALRAAWPGASAANRLAICEGLLRSAEAMALAGQRKSAIGIYAHVAGIKDVSPQVRAAVVRGEIIMRGSKDVALLKQSLVSPDYEVFAVAIRAVLEMRQTETTRVLAETLTQLTDDRALVAITALGDLGDDRAVAALLPLTKSGAKAMRLAAISAATATGNPAVVPILVGLLDDTDRGIAEAAQDGLAAITDPAAAQAVATLLNSPFPQQRVQAVELVGRRRMQSAVPALFKAAADPEQTVRVAALRRLGELAGPSELPRLLELLLQTPQGKELELTGEAVTAICLRASDPSAASATIVGVVSQAKPAQKVTLLAVMGAVGGTKALEAVRLALNDAHPEVHAAAVRAMADWPDASAIVPLFQIISATADPAERELAFSGYIRAIRESTLGNDEKLKGIIAAAALAKTSDARRLALAGLGDVTTIESLRAVAPYLSESDVAEDASASAIRIAAKLNQSQAAEIIPVLQRVVEVSKSDSVVAKARTRIQELSRTPEQKPR